jgi:hypothetical protein
MTPRAAPGPAAAARPAGGQGRPDPLRAFESDDRADAASGQPEVVAELGGSPRAGGRDGRRRAAPESGAGERRRSAGSRWCQEADSPHAALRRESERSVAGRTLILLWGRGYAVGHYQAATEEFSAGEQPGQLTSASEWEKLEGLAQAWFTDLKDWESDDTFAAAYQGGRMTVRAISGGHQKEDSFRTIDVSPIDKDGNTSKTAPLSTVGLRSGKDGIQMRMDPANLWKRGTQVGKNWSGKYEHGLHDMNASLLNPRRPWYQLKAGDGRIGQNGLVESQYGQMKPYIGGLYVFMPLPQEADLEIFFILNGLAKTTASPEWFKDSMRGRGQRLTRIKFAQERDMAVKYWDVGTLQGLGRVKITMGGSAGWRITRRTRRTRSTPWRPAWTSPSGGNWSRNTARS